MTDATTEDSITGALARALALRAPKMNPGL